MLRLMTHVLGDGDLPTLAGSPQSLVSDPARNGDIFIVQVVFNLQSCEKTGTNP